MKNRRELEYALYKGEICLAIGTKQEIAELLNIKEKTVTFYGTPTNSKRAKGKKRRTLISLDNSEIEGQTTIFDYMKREDKNTYENILIQFENWLEELYKNINFPKDDTEYSHARDVGYSFALRDCLDKLKEFKEGVN